MKQLISGLLIVLVSITLCTLPPASGQQRSVEGGAPCSGVAFRRALEVPTNEGTSSAAVSDMDGDGLKDIVVSFSHATSGMSVVRNLGGGSFAPKVDFPIVGEVPSTPFVQDLDADGKPEVLVSAALGTRTMIFKNTSTAPGSISFAPPMTVEIGGVYAGSITFGDFDADSVVDIAVSKREAGVAVFRNLSPGTGAITLATRQDFAFTSTVNTIGTGDFDGDGKPDIAVGGWLHGDRFRILRNTSTGAGDIAFNLSPGIFQGDAAAGLGIADFDGDGKLDVAMNDDAMSVFRNTSTGPGNISFAPFQNFGTLTGGVGGPVAADFDGDGKIDLAAPLGGMNSVTVFRNTSPGPGTLSFAVPTINFGVGVGPARVVVTDILGDGKPDVITGNRTAGSASIMENTSTVGNMDFVARRDYMNPANNTIFGSAVGDFNGDGREDVFAWYRTTFSTATPAIYYNNGGTLPFTRTAMPVTLIMPQDLDAADLNGDGKADLAVAITGGTLMVLRNTSTGSTPSFAESSAGQVIGTQPRVYFADFDGNGKKDVLVLSTIASPAPATPRADILLNMTVSPDSITLVQGPSVSMPGASTTEVRDIDGDGKPDIKYLVGGSSTISFKVLRNIATGPGNVSFTTQDVATDLTDHWGNAVADLDGDGDADLIGNYGHTVPVLFSLRNTGSAGSISFGSPLSVPHSWFVPQVGKDFDGDGREDLLALDRYPNGRFVVLRSTSTASHLSVETGPSLAIPSSTNNTSTVILRPRFGDLDADGKLDVVVATGTVSHAAIAIHYNRSCIVPVTHAAPFDFDADGKTDIGIFRPGDATWWIDRSSDGVVAAQFGAATDKLTPADFTGDGKTDIGIWRPASGEWFVLRSEDFSFYSAPFGTSGDVPAPADYDADGRADLAVFRQSNGTWFVARSTGGTMIEQFGGTGDLPVAADYDGDEKADPAIFRPSTGQWWIKRSSAGTVAMQFGSSTDKTVPGDYTGDGKADVAIWRPSSGEWFVMRSEDFSFYSAPFGASGDLPSPGDYDGDGRYDFTVFRPSTTTWFSQRTTAGLLVQPFGSTGDTPVPNAYVR